MKCRSFVVGDLHGCFEELMLLLNVINYKKDQDLLFLLGDLVHKGPNSAKIIDWAISNQVESILGNHDEYFRRALAGEVTPYPEYEKIVRDLKSSPSVVLKWLNERPLFKMVENTLLIHAGVDPLFLCLDEKDKNICCQIRFWNRKEHCAISEPFVKVQGEIVPWYEEVKLTQNFQQIVYGHWAKKEVQFHQEGKIIGLDTGCCYGGRLTAYCLETEEIFQIDSLQKKQFNY